MDGVGVAGSEGEGVRSVGSLEDAITAGCEGVANELADGFFVFDQEDGFGAADGGESNGSDAVRLGRFVDAGEINGEDGAAAGLALDEDVTAALLDDAVDSGESEAGAFAILLGGEERLEDAGLSFAVHALAGVANGNHDVRAVFDESIFGVVGIVESDAGGANADFAAVRHGVLGIDHEIHDDLLELSGIGAGAANGRGEAGGEFHVFPDERAQEALHVFDDGVDVDDLEFEKLLAAESKKLAGKRSSAVGGLLNGFRLNVQRISGSELVEENLGVAADHHEQIVEVVSDAAGETADGFHFLGLAELVFEDAALGDVFGDGFEDFGGMIFTGHGAATDADSDGCAILAFPADFKTVHAAGAAEFVDQASVFGRIGENIVFRIESQDFDSGVVAQHSDEGGVDVEETAFAAGAINSVDGGLHQGAVAQFGAAQGLLVAFVIDGGGQLPRD